ncbi:stress protein [Actinomadura citrea]|uniref:Stress protein n=1 Tax=Actinomadura citrea TaxID=46158 RepID=A0A7Y9KFE6_9ACTN|nr:stress protein [Actinomadura citrea]NYE15520.1 hypothetical protein [Actinomadura citrea]GGT65386.1 hypothetical protein GCM10010177_22930 [Actinomadura citrea]
MADHDQAIHRAARLAGLPPYPFLYSESERGRRERFDDMDHCAARLLEAALAGQRVINLVEDDADPKRYALVTAAPIDSVRRAALQKNMTLSAQQANGAWFLPEVVPLKSWTVNLSAHLRNQPAHALTLAADDSARVRLASSPDAMLTWTLLVPLFDQLLRPITERATASVRTPEEHRTVWLEIIHSYQRLGINAGSVLWAFAYRGGWSGLDRAGHARARIALLDTIVDHDLLSIVRAFRADRIRALIDKTVQKARRGTPLARHVLTKPMEPVLSAYFAGSWLEFLNYLELPPNPNEELMAALPKPTFFVGGAAKAGNAAAEHGIEIDDANAMLAAFLGQDTTTSPVERRVAALRSWWRHFDAAHASQRTGTPGLWGLVEDAPHIIGYLPGPTPRLYDQYLPTDLVGEVEELWSGTTLPRWPQAITTEPYPHMAMAETLGPAVTFWHGVGLTAWFVCAGPYSRTPLNGLRGYYERTLTELAALGTPIHPSLFEELEQAEDLLGPPEELVHHEEHLQMPDGAIAIKFTGGGQRRAGFEILRDIITRHRRGWSDRYLDSYLQERWTQELTAVARELHRRFAATGKAPTFRQFAKFAAGTAGHWFNGDLAALYTAIGEKAPDTASRVSLLPRDTRRFIDTVYAELGGRPYEEHLRITDFPTADRYRQRSRLATASTRYVQIVEALGRPPKHTEFGAGRYEWDWADGLERGWPLYQRAITAAGGP